MSGVRKKDQSEHRFTTLDIILDMYEHTTTVTANPKFETIQTIKQEIELEAAMIYHFCRSANEDYDNRKQDEAKIRIELQEQAIEKCMWLKSWTRLAQKKLHLRAQKIIFWNSKINAAMNAIKTWNVAEKKNYTVLFGL